MGGAGLGTNPGTGVGPEEVTGTEGVDRRFRRKKMTPAAIAAAAMASMAIPVGDRRMSRREAGGRTSVKRTAWSFVAFRRFVHVAESAVVLLGGGVPAGTMIFTE